MDAVYNNTYSKVRVKEESSMKEEIPYLVEELYYQYSHELVPESWVGGFEDNPAQGHGLWSFYQGLKLGMRLSAICLDQL